MKGLQKKVPNQFIKENFTTPIKNNDDSFVDIPEDCDDINNKINSWYWIQPPCSNKKIQIYCDFSFKNHVAYHLLNLTNRKELNFHDSKLFL